MRAWIVGLLLISLPAGATALTADSRGVTLENRAGVVSFLRGATLGGAPVAPGIQPKAHLVSVDKLDLDHGLGDELAGGGYGVRGAPILALLFGLILGFGTGHLIAGDIRDFIIWLVIDVVVIVVVSFLDAFVGYYGSFVFLALVVTHVIQGIDAYYVAGGGRMVQQLRDRAIMVAGADGEERRDRAGTGAVIVPRAFALNF